MTPVVNIMLKPASGLCNLRCKYCFYADETSKREVPSYGIMSVDTLRCVLRKTLLHTTRECTIAFQGGEPTLAGLDFFRNAVAIAKEENRNHCTLHFALQTNGTLLDRQWCNFLAENHFLVGISLDGTKELHDQNRVDAGGNGTYGSVVQAIRLLEAHHVDFNILTVLTGNVCRSTRKVYQHYSRNNWNYQQYIPCLDPHGEPRGQHSWAMTPQRYEQYLKAAFDCWYEDVVKGQKKYHRYFDNLLLMMDGQMPEACGMCGHCSMQYVVEADGSVFPCDFYMLDEYRLGNLCTDSFDALDRKRKELGFIEASQVPAQECLECQWKTLCRGGCRRDRDFFAHGLKRNYYCESYKSFFSYAWPRLKKVYMLVKYGNPLQ